jgi:hypothetical protein
MSNYIISTDVATDDPTVIITSVPYGHYRADNVWITTMRCLDRIEKIKRIFNA